MSWKDISNLDRETIFFISVGTMEAHGPHLPVGTDLFIAKHVEKELLKNVGGVSLPSISYSKCHYLEGFEGSISVSSRAVKKILTSILLHLAKNGFKYAVICNFHMDIFHLRAIYKSIFRAYRYGMNAVEPISASYFDGKLFDDIEGEIHADEKETSLALYLFPELVGDYSSLPPFRKRITMMDSFKKFIHLGAKDAYIGSPSMASAEKGKLYFEKMIDACMDGIERMKRGEKIIPERLKILLRL